MEKIHIGEYHSPFRGEMLVLLKEDKKSLKVGFIQTFIYKVDDDGYYQLPLRYKGQLLIRDVHTFPVDYYDGVGEGWNGEPYFRPYFWLDDYEPDKIKTIFNTMFIYKENGLYIRRIDVEEFRRKVCAKKIQRVARGALYNPERKMCRNIQGKYHSSVCK